MSALNLVPKSEDIIDSYEIISSPMGKGIVINDIKYLILDYLMYLDSDDIIDNFELLIDVDEIFCGSNETIVDFYSTKIDNFEDQFNNYMINRFKVFNFFDNDLPYYYSDTTVIIYDTLLNRIINTNETSVIRFEDYQVIMIDDNKLDNIVKDLTWK